MPAVAGPSLGLYLALVVGRACDLRWLPKTGGQCAQTHFELVSDRVTVHQSPA